MAGILAGKFLRGHNCCGLFLVILWFTVERKRFEGSPTGEKIEARQNQIAAIEARLFAGNQE
jgi:hypothetical protein